MAQYALHCIEVVLIIHIYYITQNTSDRGEPRDPHILRTSELAIEQRKASIQSAIFYSLVWIPVLVFLVLLSNKLDSKEPSYSHRLSRHIETSFFMVSIPLYFVFLILICFSFNSKGNNQCNLHPSRLTFLFDFYFLLF